MGFKLRELEEGSQVILQISNESNNTMEMKAIIQKFVKNDVVLLDIDYEDGKTLLFDNVHVDMEYCFENVMPIIWRNVKIVNYKGKYLMQVSGEGMRHNRRDSFRVGVGLYGKLRRNGRGFQDVLIRDISVSGFSITDKRKELGFQVGDKIEVEFCDFGFEFVFVGKVVRIEEREDMNIYGLELCNLCKDLSVYVNVKQRHKNSQNK